MDDDLLADDGQYKDDGLDDLDIDAEAALLGMSDDEDIEDDRSQNDDQELEYVDEDGNPVTIGENNADQYEVAVNAEKLSNPPDEDVLELDLDAELESFQETSDILRESPTPTKSYNNERQRKENLISLTSRKDQERPPLRRKESRYSPEKDLDRSNKDASFSNQSHASRIEPRDSFGDEFDEESEDESIADDHRERFKSERSNIITLTPAKRRTDIPDTLESVISVEETAKVQAFLENEQKRKMRFKGKVQGRMKPPQRFQRPTQTFTNNQGQQSSQFSSSNAPSVSQPVSATPQPRKILINPHFRGIRIPPPAEPAHTLNEVPPQVSVPPPSYEASNFPPPPVQYTHQEPLHPVSVAPPPIYTAPPPAVNVQYKHPEYPPPQQPVQQIPPPTWQQPPEMPVQSYSMPPPPVMNYGDPVTQPPNYNTYNQNYQNTSYQNPPMPMPQPVNYSQPPPPVHLYTQSFPTQPVNPVSSSMAPTQYSPPSQIRMQPSIQPQHYQEASMSQPPIISHTQKPRFSQNSQRFSRPPEKRMASTNVKHVPLKQPRLEHPPRKTNVHVNNSNIREIPLVDTLPPAKRPITVNKTVPIVEEEDEKTRELRMKIEEQKLLREQILKRKEERRRQMAAQRLMELKKRQAEQNKNTVTIIPKAVNQNNQVKTVSTVKQPVVKPSVKERIGPLNANLPITKKKIVVVRKKVQQQNIVSATPATSISKSPDIVGQRIKLPISSQKPNSQQTAKPVNTIAAPQVSLNTQTPIIKPVTNEPSKPAVPPKAVENKAQPNLTRQKNQVPNPPKKVSLNAHAQRIKNMRLGNRPNFQRPQFSQLQRMHRPRVPVPRGAQFPSPPFVEPRMPFPSHGPRGPPMNDMRMPPPHFQDPRPPLLPFCHPPREPGRPFNRFFPPEMPNSPPFRMRGPILPNFRPGGMERPVFHDRFPPPQFRNQMPQMRPMLDSNMQRFQRPPRFHQQEKQRFSSNNNINQRPMNQPKVIRAKPPAPAPVPVAAPTPTRVPTPATQASNVNQKSNNTPIKGNDTKPVSKVCLTRNQPKNGSNNIQLLKSERKAIIKFKEPRQALMFQKKYQRYMLDLAMIQVSLLPS